MLNNKKQKALGLLILCAALILVVFYTGHTGQAEDLDGYALSDAAL